MFASTVLSRLTKSTSQPLLPISASASASTAPPYTDAVRPSPSDASATLLALARQEAHLQSHIQYLLDVQSDRLIEGLGEPQPSPKHQQDNSPPPNNASSSSSLQTTRHDLSAAISALASLKGSSVSILSASLAAATASLSAITSIQRRKSALTAKIAELLEHYSSPPPPPASSTSLSLVDDDHFLGREEEEVREEEEALGREIEEAENRLWAMKARRRVLREKVQQGRNRREARVSSWRRSLELLGEEEEEVVRKDPAASSLFAREGKGKGRESVWDLKPERRTLEMVREWYVSEQEGLAGRLEDVGKERDALEEGGKVWAEVVRVVGGVEALLEKEMNGLDNSSSSSSEDGGEHERRRRRREEGMERVLKAMKDARESIEEKL
ncbi:MAG: hypothetical protein L6R35_006041, partial [Caloplaca aegaea]